MTYRVLHTSSTNYGDGAGNPGLHRGRLFIVLHGTGKRPGVTAEQELAFLTKPNVGVSYHWYVTKAGEAIQLVPEASRAWHAGSSVWTDTGTVYRDLNDWSVGVAFESSNGLGEDYPPEQIVKGQELCRDLMRRWKDITPERILTHKQVSDPIGRKVDPVNFPTSSFVADLRSPLPRPIPLYTERNELLGHLTLIENRKAYIPDAFLLKLRLRGVN